MRNMCNGSHCQSQCFQLKKTLFDRSKFYDESRLRTMKLQTFAQIMKMYFWRATVMRELRRFAIKVALTILYFQNYICLIAKLKLMKNLRL